MERNHKKSGRARGSLNREKTDQTGTAGHGRKRGPPPLVGRKRPPPAGTDEAQMPVWAFLAAILVALVVLLLLALLLSRRAAAPPESAQGNEPPGGRIAIGTPMSAPSDGQPAEEGAAISGKNSALNGATNDASTKDAHVPQGAGAEVADGTSTDELPPSEPQDQEAVTSDGDKKGESTENRRVDEKSGSKPPKRNGRTRFFSLPDQDDGARRPAASHSTSRRSEVITRSLSGRKAGAKEKLLQEFGGTDVTEGAVALGLEWLARNQLKNGLWSLAGPYRDGSPTENHAAASAMALLAFQGAGHTHRGDAGERFTRVVGKAWTAIRKHIQREGVFPSESGEASRHQLYTHALGTIALCELYGMTHDPKYGRLAKQAIRYCVAAQSPQGGWRYRPGGDSDMSVTGWVIMALQSARMAGITVPRKTLAGASAFLDAAATQGGRRYSYQPGVAPTLSMTAEALLCRQYLGWQRDDPRLIDGTKYLLTQLPNWNSRDVYYWYYATQVCHHMEGDYWQQWNEVMRTLLPAKQVKEGAERGSWDPQGDRWDSVAGRLYVTCLSLYMLEVYYRHLPLYRRAAIGRNK